MPSLPHVRFGVLSLIAASALACATATSSGHSTHDGGTAGGDDASTSTTPGGDDSGGSTTTPGGGDSGGTTTTPGGDDSGGTTTSPPPTDAASGADACKAPGKLHPPKAGYSDFYCPFVSPAKTYCKDQTEHCCEPATGSASCQPISTPCATGDTDWQCDDPSGCPSGQQCCGTGTLVISPDPACENYASRFKGTHCAASCDPATEIVMCTSTGECAGGTTCTPFTTKGNQVGGCH